jgi:hypothetical protein
MGKKCVQAVQSYPSVPVDAYPCFPRTLIGHGDRDDTIPNSGSFFRYFTAAKHGSYPHTILIILSLLRSVLSPISTPPTITTITLINKKKG